MTLPVGPLFLGSLGWPEILLIALVIVLLFGARKLPEIGAGLGRGIRGFRESLKGDEPPEGKEIEGEGEQKNREKGGK